MRWDKNGAARMATVSQRDGSNYYEILEVASDAPQAEIHKAYQRAKATYSQDNPALYSMFSKEEAKELLRMIEEAFAVLGNASLRRTYDENLKEAQANPGRRPVSVGSNNGQPNPGQASQSHSNSSIQAVTPQQKLASEQKALPDFPSPEQSGEYTVRKSENSKNAIPAGMAKTSLSTYKVDEAVENELKAATDFDGVFLQKIRLYKNVSIDRLSEATRISRPYLMALETNDYKNLPAAVFVRGFVVQIARNLGLDETKVAASYMKAFKAGGGK